MADALVQVKSALGTDAVILHTRTYSRRRWLGLRKQEVVEITAGKGLGAAARTSRRSIPAKAPVGAPHDRGDQPVAAASLGGTQAQPEGWRLFPDGLGNGSGMVGERQDGARAVLKAAAWTYVAGALTALLTFLYYAWLIFGRRD